MQNRVINIKTAEKGPDYLLKRGVWIYFFLLIFEGALRKWVLPGLATPLLIIRDPIAVWLIYEVWNRGMLPSSNYLKGMVWVTIIAVITALIFGHGNIFVALFGARIFLIHFPLIFVIGRIFDREDVLQMGRVLLWITIPMAILIAMQFYSPQSAWVNRGIGGDESGGGFSGAMGYFRPPATFSFTNGTYLFFGFAGCFLFYFWLAGKEANKLLMYASTAAVIAAIPLSISRSLTFTLGVTLMFVLLSAIRKPANLLKMVFTIVGFVFILAILSNISFFQTATDAFFSRFTSAGETEGGLKGTLGDRYLGGMINTLLRSAEQPFFGMGIGMGTNVGSMLLVGKTIFLVDEGEWGRVIGEMGAILGLGVIYIRIGLSFKLLANAYNKMVSGDLLPWLILSFALTVIPQGQWSQPTALGFSVLSGGLLVASMKKRKEVPVDKPLKMKTI
ncbi:hypothetical protein SAMN06265348_103243 [Pedobacter westerhofensis]|uniref:O-Antigen ligase n=1 Tax=Pedobacter westerhofensis TaxID=425512 RepID=A0A521C5M9_9SPHI|nr:hypothetical protein [Pedobacter westerhofensis]SMO54756.1 hypothetical protein SAMN06265348_103243 [Pedobacter westerhofensis]